MNKINIITNSLTLGKPHTREFHSLNCIVPTRLDLGEYIHDSLGIPLSGSMVPVESGRNVGNVIHTYPLASPVVESIRVDVNRPTKELQSKVLSEVVVRLGLDLKIPQLLTEGTDDVVTIIKPKHGAKSWDVVKHVGYGIPEDMKSQWGECKQYEYIDNIVEEYRLMPVPGWETCGYKRTLVPNSKTGTNTPKVVEGDVYDLDLLSLPTHVQDDIIALVKELDLWGYAIDVFKTDDGQWGIFEYSPEYGIVGIPEEQAIKVRSLTFQYFIRTAMTRGPVEIDYRTVYFKYRPLVNATNPVGSYVRALRLELGWDIHKAAKEIGVSGARLSELETGQIKLTDYFANKLELRYGVTRAELEAIPKHTEVLDDLVRDMSPFERRRFELYLASTFRPQGRRRGVPQHAEKVKSNKVFEHRDRTMAALLNIRN